MANCCKYFWGNKHSREEKFFLGEINTPILLVQPRKNKQQLGREVPGEINTPILAVQPRKINIAVKRSARRNKHANISGSATEYKHRREEECPEK